MADNNEPGCLYHAALGAFGAAAFIVGTTVGYGIRDYQEETAPVSETSIESQREAVCDLAVGPLKHNFKKNCNRENFERGDLLKKISQEKNQILESIDCQAQIWECKPSKPYDLENSQFEAIFRYK